MSPLPFAPHAARFASFTSLVKLLRRFGLLMLLCSSLSSTALAADSDKAWAYFAWWLPQSWRSAPLAQIDRLLFFELRVSPQGLVAERNGWPEKWGELRESLGKSATPLDLVLTLLNERDFQSVFSSQAATRQLLEQASALASDPGVAGLHLDFEVFTATPISVQARFRQFVVDLSKNLRARKPARNLSVFLPIGGEAQIYDLRSIAVVDHVVAQGYDAHWSSGPSAGPVAPLDGESSVTWKKAVAQALALGVKRDKLILSYPLYGYEWPTQDKDPRGLTRGEGVTTTLAPVDPRFLPAIQTNVQDRIKLFGASNDALSGSSYYQFQKNGRWTTGWYEGQWALGKKMSYLHEQKLAGMAFFLLGYDEGKVMEAFLRLRVAKKSRSCVGSCPARASAL
jgi:spore germination protein